MIRAKTFRLGTISPNSQKLHNMGIIKEIRCAMSVLIIPEFSIAFGTNKNTVGINNIKGKAIVR